MKQIFIITTISILPSLLKAQSVCDSAAIFATTGANAVCFEIETRVRYCFSNNYPNHTDNYNQPQFTLTEDDEQYNMCAYPDTNDYFSPLYEDVETTGCSDTYIFGVLSNGVRLDPSSGDVFVKSDGTNNIEWHIEAAASTTTTGQNMGTLNGGHLNPFGDYHYHKAPTDYFLNILGINGTAHSPIVGYAADGFPIYYKYVNTDANDTTSAIVALSSGYSLKSGSRPGDGNSAPDGTYDGTYYEDYEYTSTTLDSCNGRYGITPDYPYGTYYYVLTDNYPFIPRCFKGEDLDNSFRVGPDASCPTSKASSQCPKVIEGCLDPFADNYAANANKDDGSCTYSNLPVEWIQFTAEEAQGKTLLSWTTATELNNSHFEIEYSQDGFEFHRIGKIQGSGTIDEVQEYKFLHQFPANGKNYYRLKQVDLDGNHEYSNIILLEINTVQQSKLNIFPNPTKGQIIIETDSDNMIFVSNIYGQVVFQANVNGRQQVDLTHLSSGVYLISNGIQSQKLIIE